MNPVLFLQLLAFLHLFDLGRISPSPFGCVLRSFYISCWCAVRSNLENAMKCRPHVLDPFLDYLFCFYCHPRGARHFIFSYICLSAFNYICVQSCNNCCAL